MNTTKLYDTDSYCSQFTAKVLLCEQNGENYKVILDRTAFFPEGGGQYSDTGYLNNSKVLDVQIENGIIYHYCDTPLNINDNVIGKIDFNERFDKMQQHTGEHIISGIVNKLYGYNNTGFHLSDNIVTLDFDGTLNREQINNIEILANECVHKNVSVSVSFPNENELNEINYRSKLDLTENVRLVTIEGYDVCACCAPHVSSTGQVGSIKLLECEKHKSGVRITIKCGMRAVLDYQDKYKNIQEISALLCAKQSDTADAVLLLQEENNKLKYNITGLKREICEMKLAQISNTNENVVFFENDMDAASLRFLADKGSQKCRIFAVVNRTETGTQLVCCSKQVDLKQNIDFFKEKLSLLGGGNNTMLQGKITADEKTVKNFFLYEI